MPGYLLKRALYSFVSLAGLLVLVFFLVRMTGDPGNLYLPLDATQEARAEFSARNGFDDPVYVQFGRYVGDLVRGDLGDSIRQQRPAIDIVMEAIPVTLWLAAMAMLLALGGAIVVGALAAYRPGSVFDRFASVSSLVGASAPDFWVAITAIIVFSISLQWLPTSGLGGPVTWIMPVCVLVIRPFGLLVQVVRSSMLTVFSSAYIKTARAKGVKERAVIFVHALRNAMIPVITVAGDQAAGIANGAVIVETIFGWPGIGKTMIDAIMQRDFAVVQAAILVTAVVILCINIIVDVVYAMLDPRIRP
ncbi:MAG: ABC transporter permease [Burkholderiaceae bacterium]